MRLKDKVANVTGDASGMGHATSVILAQERARVTSAELMEEFPWVLNNRRKESRT